MGIRNKRKKKRPYKNNKITTRSFVKMEDLKKFYFNLIILKQSPTSRFYKFSTDKKVN